MEKEKLETEFDYVHKEYTLDQWYYKWLDMYKRPYIKESSVTQFVVQCKNLFGKRIGNRKLKNIRNLLFSPDIRKWNQIKNMQYGHYIHQQLEMFNFANKDVQKEKEL